MPRRIFKKWEYHVYNRWLGKMIIFKNRYDFERFSKLVIKYNKLEKYKDIKILSYSLIPNHFHFILYNPANNPGIKFKNCVLNPGVKDCNISDFIWNIQNAYAKYFNIKYKRKGSLFEWRFKAKYIEDKNYLNKCLAYVSFNAIKHKLVDNIDNYPRTSYHQLKNKDKIEKYRDLILDELEF